MTKPHNYQISRLCFGGRDIFTCVVVPAAEAERPSILQKASLTMVDEMSDQIPGTEIAGEAFSTHGLRRPAERLQTMFTVHNP
jgi:hypothetical protein